ncbi:capsular exopolysaccharide synthesis family protein [Geodermatophilus normandii]|uniref:Capsular exopolysaccharide synthesis family protein n=1 Tax=Geodermatophilus normandii TaxID=1137989 RepID=A0A317QCK0_9ACTN|nr:polysaccharide biosynthesis tyrosine autokinase [Geodermatophilus normandii]PWW21398.1 capsular exopolysaccharide synthesis family protein [Geodermatophilus normandii]
MDLHEFLQMLRRRWRWVVAGALVGLAVAGAASLTTPRSYEASSSVFFSLSFGDSADDLVQGSAFAQNQVASYAMLATTPTVLDPVIDELGLDTTARRLAGRVSTEVMAGTVVLQVRVSDASPQRAAELTNAVTEQLVETVADLAPATAEGQPTVRGTTVSPAVAPTAPSAPRTTLNLAIGLLAGLVLGIAAGLARDLTDTRVRRPEDLSRVTDLPLLAALDTPPGRDHSRDLVVLTAPRSPAAEAVRSLRTAVQFSAQPGRPLSLLVTSSHSGEGKSTVAANLALALADAGLRVALVDADLRRPSVADTFGLEGAAGLTTVLIGQAELDDVLQEWGSAGLHVLTTGPLPPNPSELLASPAMTDLLARLERTHDVVLVDGAPLLPVTDSAVLARVVSGTMVVGDTTRIRRPALTSSLALLRRLDARVVGIVLTHVRRRSGDTYGYESQEGAAEQVPASSWRAPLARAPRDATPVGRG